MSGAWVTEKLLPALNVKGCITVQEIVAKTGIELTKVKRSVCVLHDRKLVTRIDKGCYRLTAAGRLAIESAQPIRSGPLGQRHTGRRTHKDTMRGRVWKAFRQSRKATVNDLVALATPEGEQVCRKDTAKYLQQLVGAGYAIKLGSREPGTSPTSNGFLRFALIKDTGPEAPVYSQRDNVLYDPNTRETFPIGGAS